jgi:hypothetical protein
MTLGLLLWLTAVGAMYASGPIALRMMRRTKK